MKNIRLLFTAFIVLLAFTFLSCNLNFAMENFKLSENSVPQGKVLVKISKENSFSKAIGVADVNQVNVVVYQINATATGKTDVDVDYLPASGDDLLLEIEAGVEWAITVTGYTDSEKTKKVLQGKKVYTPTGLSGDEFSIAVTPIRDFTASDKGNYNLAFNFPVSENGYNVSYWLDSDYDNLQDITVEAAGGLKNFSGELSCGSHNFTIKIKDIKYGSVIVKNYSFSVSPNMTTNRWSTDGTFDSLSENISYTVSEITHDLSYTLEAIEVYENSIDESFNVLTGFSSDVSDMTMGLYRGADYVLKVKQSSSGEKIEASFENGAELQKIDSGFIDPNYETSKDYRQYIVYKAQNMLEKNSVKIKVTNANGNSKTYNLNFHQAREIYVCGTSETGFPCELTQTPSGINAKGSERYPYASISDAINSIPEGYVDEDDFYSLYISGVLKSNSAYSAVCNINSNVNVKILGYGSNGGSIDGNNQSQCISVSKGIVTLGENLTVQNGKYAAGAGVSVSGDDETKVYIDGAVIKNNVATGSNGGGGIYIAHGYAELKNGEIISNTADSGSGGGVYCRSNSFFAKFVYSGGKIQFNSAYMGGGVCLYGGGQAELLSDQISSNTCINDRHYGADVGLEPGTSTSRPLTLGKKFLLNTPIFIKTGNGLPVIVLSKFDAGFIPSSGKLMFAFDTDYSNTTYTYDGLKDKQFIYSTEVAISDYASCVGICSHTALQGSPSVISVLSEYYIDDEGKIQGISYTPVANYIGTTEFPPEKTLSISTKEELQQIAAWIDAGIGDTTTGGMREYTFYLMNDIDMEDSSVVIGSSSTNTTAFRGTFLGQGNKIYNYKLETTTGKTYNALFGYVKNGVISDLTVHGTIDGGRFTGGIVGYLYGGKIKNCISKVTVNSNTYAGGIAGYAVNSAEIIDCINFGNITCGNFVGGICSDVENSSNIYNCVNVGSVSGTGYNIGGLVGYLNARVYNSVNMGSVTGSSTATVIGGCVGSKGPNLMIENCYNAGAVINNNASNGSFGYFAGDITSAPGNYYVGNTSKPSNIYTDEQCGITRVEPQQSSVDNLSNILLSYSQSNEGCRDWNYSYSLMVEGVNLNLPTPVDCTEPTIP